MSILFLAKHFGLVSLCGGEKQAISGLKEADLIPHFSLQASN